MTPRAGAARRRLRRRRGTRPTLGQRLSVWFDRLLYLGVLGGLVLSAFGSVLEGVPTDLAARPGVGPVLAALLAVALLKGGVALGPLFAGRATATWLLSTPIDRRSLLLGHGLAAIAAGAVLGAAVALVTGALSPPVPPVTPSPGPMAELLAAPLTGALVGASAVAVLLLVQSAGPRLQRRATRVLDVAVVLAVLGWTAVLATPTPLAPDPVGVPVPAFALVVVAVVAVGVAIHRMGRIERRTLRHGADLATVTSVSVTFLDLTPLSAMLLDRRARALGRVRSIRLGGGRRSALLGADLVRCTRSRPPALVAVGLVLVPLLVRDVGSAGLAAAVHAVGATLVADRFARGLRLVCRSAALRRAVGGTDLELRLLRLVVPAVAAVGWSAVAGAVAGVAVGAVALSAAGAVLVVYRSATRPPLDYGSATYDVGLFGPTPVGLLVQLARGPAMLGVVVVLQLVLSGST